MLQIKYLLKCPYFYELPLPYKVPSYVTVLVMVKIDLSLIETHFFVFIFRTETCQHLHPLK